MFIREVTFVDNTDDAEAEICLVDKDKDDSVIRLDGSKKVYQKHLYILAS